MSDVYSQFETLFTTHQNTLEWQPQSDQLRQLVSLYEGICEGNTRLNLTRITSVEDFWEKHLWDSFVALNPLWQDSPETGRILDIGTGGGFPGLPLAIAYPSYQVTLLDSIRKKIAFLHEFGLSMGLNSMAIADRAEALAHQPDHREQYDLVTIRAVAKAAVCVEYALPFLAVGGIAILYRGQWSEAETELLMPAIAQCGGVLEDVLSFTTPITQGQRTCIYIKKIEATDLYLPRAIGTPKQSPLADV